MKVIHTIHKLAVTVLLAAVVAFATERIHAQEATAESTASKSDATATNTESTAQKADTEWDGVTVELTSVKRDEGASITVQFKYANTGSKKVEFWTTGNYSHANLAALVYYIDPKNKKKYTVIEDTEQKPVASSSSEIALEPGASKLGWAKLPAPPADVTSITVVIPGAPPFEKVALAGK